MYMTNVKKMEFFSRGVAETQRNALNHKYSQIVIIYFFLFKEEIANNTSASPRLCERNFKISQKEKHGDTNNKNRRNGLRGLFCAN